MLRDDVSDDPMRVCLAEIVESVALASDRGDLQELLHRATVAVGAERSFFMSVSGEGEESSYAFVLDSDAVWWHRYRAVWPLESNPWIDYAIRHSAPVQAARLRSSADSSRSAIDLAAQTGFASTILVPAHSGRAERRVGLLCLGHSKPAYFEAAAFARVQPLARSLALELHAWWIRHEQQEMAQRVRLSEADLELLARHCAGLSSKQIAREMQVSCEAINSRFQRVIAKLGVRNRRAAARIAVECGLIDV